MLSLASLAYAEMLILLGGFFGVVFWKLLTQPGAFSGLLQGDRYDGPNRDFATEDFTTGRARLLISPSTLPVYYLLQILHSSSRFHLFQMP